MSLFWNDLKDLIVYDFAQSKNLNVGRRGRGASRLGWQQEVLPELSADATYTWLRRAQPRHRRPARSPPAPPRRAGPGLETAARLRSVSAAALFVGSRADADPGTGAPMDGSSYARVDLAARWQATQLSLPTCA